MRIESGQLRQVINDYLTTYGEGIREAVETACAETGKVVAKELKKAGDFNGTAFKKSWTTKTELTRLGASTIVYNKDHYQLAHLLEFGHATRDGGRTKAFNFIAPINDEVEGIFMGELNELIG